MTAADEAAQRRRDEPEVLRRYSQRLARGFGVWLDRYFRRSFDGVRTTGDGSLPTDPEQPLLVYSNHPSWWDPIHFFLLAQRVLPERRMFGPFDAAALEKYGFFKRLGGFGIDPETRTGAATFLATSRAVLAAPRAMLWITAQGEFSDPRHRPVVLRPGVAHLVRRLDRGLVIPAAVEYPFWNERLPEALSRFGRPIDLAEQPERDVEEWTELLASRLTETMDELRDEAASRDEDRFRTLVLGRAGVGGVYDMWRRLKAALSGRRFDPAHQDGRR